MSESQHGKYIVVFKNHATDEQIQKHIGKVEESGGLVTNKYGSVMKGFAAHIPPTYLTNLQSDTHIIDYIEPDGVVKTQ